MTPGRLIRVPQSGRLLALSMKARKASSREGKHLEDLQNISERHEIGQQIRRKQQEERNHKKKELACMSQERRVKIRDGYPQIFFLGCV